MSSEVVDALIQHLKEGANKFGDLQQRFYYVEITQRKHEQVLTDGANGQKPLVVQMELVNADIEAIYSQLTIEAKERQKVAENLVERLEDELKARDKVAEGLSVQFAAVKKEMDAAKVQRRNAYIGLVGTFLLALAAVLGAWLKAP